MNKTIFPEMTNTSEAIRKVIESNPAQFRSLKTGNIKFRGFIVGKVMKEMTGNGDPALINKALDSFLS